MVLDGSDPDPDQKTSGRDIAPSQRERVGPTILLRSARKRR